MYKGVDLGYTKGGVEVDVTTATHQVNVDQFGESVVNEFITKRDIKVVVPLAETTLENLVAIMPGSSLVGDGSAASATITISTNPVANDTVVVNGVTFTFVATATTPFQVTIGGTAAATAANLQAKLAASTAGKVVIAKYTVNAAIVTVTYDSKGVEGNTFTLVKTGTGVTLSAATLTGGVNPTKQRVDVTNGLQAGSLLANSGALVLHPIDKLDTDLSEDLIIPKAGTAGGMKFAYKHNEERIFNTEFMGYPDPVTQVLFTLGDPTAV
jgi:hypothetical protein